MVQPSRGGIAVIATAVLTALAVLVGGALVSASAGSPGPPSARDDVRAPRGPASVAPQRPDIVLVLMDDFSLELLQHMPQAQRMVADGASYHDSFVVDSLCCPSRASLLTGLPPHLTGVRTNAAGPGPEPVGGFEAFRAGGNQGRQFSVALAKAGYRTGFVGKFMNGYEAPVVDGVRRPPPRVPGWSDWQAVLGGGYNGWGFRSTYLDDLGRVGLRQHPAPPRESPVEVLDDAYVQSVIERKALAFVREHRDREQPYFLEVATYGPHGQLSRTYPDNPVFPSAFADRAPAGDPTGGHCGPRPCSALGLADLAGYGDPREDNAPTFLAADATTSPAPAWRTNAVTLTDAMALEQYRDRARMVQSIDRTLGRLRAAIGPDAYLVLTADNGFHLGQHQLNGGKGTPYDSDTRVPMVVLGPDVPPGPREQVVSTLDLAPTIEDLAGVAPSVERAGTSFAASLRDPRAPGGRFAFVEHTQVDRAAADVDVDAAVGGAIDVVPSYVAVRGKAGLLVRLDLDPGPAVSPGWELYRYDVPWEDRNVFAEDHDEPWARELMARLIAWDGCAPAACRAATR